MNQQRKATPIELAVLAQSRLADEGGFTLDEYGKSASGEWWAVSVKGKEQVSPEGIPTQVEIVKYLKTFGMPDSASLFGGWQDGLGGAVYLDRTLLFFHKHTAVHEAIRNGQKAIFNLATKELFVIPPVEVLKACPHGGPDTEEGCKHFCAGSNADEHPCNQ